MAKVKREPLTYERAASDRSFFRDLSMRDRDPEAAQRLERHATEMAMELRVNPNRLAGQGGNFAPPLWLIEQFATAPRAGRVLADLIPKFPMPAGVQTVNLPRLTTGNSETDVNDLQADPDTDIVDAATSSPVVEVSGQADVSVQLLEQSPQGAHLDWVMYKDLTEAADQDLETRLFNGLGTGGQFTGLLNLTGTSSQTFTSASPAFSSSGTASNNLYPVMGAASAQVGDKRHAPPECWIMTTSRWSWIATSNDNQGRPIVPPDLAAPPDVRDGNVTPVSSIYGWPVFLSDAIPANLGAGLNQDAIFAVRPSDLLLFEGDDRTMVGMEVLSGTLQARLQLRRYAAAILGRYPTGVAAITGTGMVVQSGF